MGSSWSNHQNIIKKNQEYISEMNRIKMERWIQMHYQIKEREHALKIAKDRELFFWLSGFYILFTINALARYKRTKRSGVLGPLLPLTFITAYYADLSYGSKLHRIRAEADMILQHEQELLEWPTGIPTVASIDEARVEVEMEHKMHPHAP
ncbi:plasminogen receptor (KT) [Condylostylus longicornis]|uniref:plasminogen receptor (KT) n=1 Tax=Condylostylus longicornis TaxID=2530218 RepID=UPI00244DBD8B|nr:plasminogen receptor (KT) [Condylostylus longicornis]